MKKKIKLHKLKLFRFFLLQMKQKQKRHRTTSTAHKEPIKLNKKRVIVAIKKKWNLREKERNNSINNYFFT